MTGEQAGPWGPQALRLVAAVYGLSLVLMAVGWFRVSGSDTTGTQIGWLNLSVAGVLLAGTVNAVWLLQGRKGITRLRRNLLPPSFGIDEEADSALTGRPGPGAGSAALVATAQMTRYHRPDCLLVAGKNLAPATRPAHESPGRRPCETCRP